MTEQAVKESKPEGSLATFPINSIKNNRYRPDEVFQWNEEKILGLQESIKTTGFWSNVEVTVDKWGQPYIAGGGHHRLEALRRLIKEDGDGIRGVFKNDDGEYCIKVVKKKYTKDEMLQMFMLENADAWGKDTQQNICMMVVQIKDYLDTKLRESKDVEDFIANVNSPYPLKMDKAAHTRALKTGCGASTIVQFVGENTWSRAAIEMAIKTLYADGKNGKALRELAEKLPSVTTAYQFRNLMILEHEGDKVLSSEEDQKKVMKLIENNQLSRADIEKANKIRKEQDLTPQAAVEELIKTKKGELDAKKPTKEPVSKPKMKLPEESLERLKAARNFIQLLLNEESGWSKAQFNQAKELFKDIGTALKELDPSA